MKEEFKMFVKKRPELISYVNDGSMTWQKFYEQWYLYGEDEKIWSKYKKETKETKESENKSSSFNFSNFVKSLKNVNMDEVQKGVNSMQKAVELLQGLVTKDTSQASNTSSYTPRQLFKKFED